MYEGQLPFRERVRRCVVCIGVWGGVEQCGCLRSDLSDGWGKGRESVCVHGCVVCVGVCEGVESMCVGLIGTTHYTGAILPLKPAPPPFSP